MASNANMLNITKNSLLMSAFFAFFGATVVFSQSFYSNPQDPCADLVIRNPYTGQAVVEINSNSTNISAEEAARQANQLHSNLRKEVDNRYFIRQSQPDKSSFPEASLFLENYDRIQRIQQQNLSKTISTIPLNRILDIHISWLINRHIDLKYQLQKAPDEKLQKELNNVTKELTYLQGHSLVGEKLKKLIADYLGKAQNVNSEKPDKPNPEIYFLRGMFSKRCYSYNLALSDFLQGFECIKRDPDINVADYIIYFPEIRNALSKSLNTNSKIAGPVDTNGSSQVSFAYGYSAFWEGDYNEAIILFTDAILDNGQVPIYWYYRALAWKRIGEMNEADDDAIKGTIVERKVFGKRTPVVGFYLQRVQGDERKWLEYKRIGFK